MPRGSWQHPSRRIGIIDSMPPSNVSTEPSISRTEYLWLAGAILLGVVLRLGFPGRMAIEHFDEGVYASNFWFDEVDGYEYPARHLYAPPLLPLAIEWTMIFAALCGIRPTGFIPMIPCLIAGIATVPSLWWINRRWFGPTAGIVAAWLVAGSDFHASYSRSALTDVPVCLFILWGVYFIWQAQQSGTRRAILLAALFTGLAWWTKYNGWLPLAVGLAGGTVWQLFLPRAERQLFTLWKRWLLVASLAFVIWFPVLIGLQKHGGYSAVASNHRQYIVGLSGWGRAAFRQLECIGIYDNWWGVAFELRSGDASQVSAFASQHPMLPMALRLLTPILLGLVALAGCVSWIVTHRRTPNESSGWMILAWISGLSVATPFYHPYPRLVLPWLIAVWLGVGLAVHLLIASGRLGTVPWSSFPKWRANWCEFALAGWLFTLNAVRCGIGTEHCWQDRSDLARTTDALAAQIKKLTATAGFAEDQTYAYVYGEPSIFFALRASGLSLVGPVQNLDFMAGPHPRPTFLFRTTRVFQDVGFIDQWEAHEHFLEPIAQKRIGESHLVRFDTIPRPTQNVTFLKSNAIRGEDIQVFRVR